jgi:hypothetical protein
MPLSGVGKVTGLLSRLAARRAADEEPEPATTPGPVEAEGVVPTKALKKFIALLRLRPSPTILDLGPVVGSNIAFFGEQLGCKVFIGDILGDLERFESDHGPDGLPAFLATRFPQERESVDGVVCWDVFDFLDKSSARVVADHLMRVMRPNGALVGFFATAQAAESRFSKFIIADDCNLRYRSYSKPRMRQAALQNRDIIQLFERLRVSDSFLLHTMVREILFRKPDYLPNP